MPPLTLPSSGRVAIIAPHPDDEVFAVGGLMAELQGRGCVPEIIAVTDGEASHANSKQITPARLRTVRRDESQRAYSALGIEPAVRRLGMPDSRLAVLPEELRAAFRHQLQGVALCLAPIETDGHPDHDACGQAAIEICAELGVQLWRYAVWSRLNPERISQGEPSIFPLPALTLQRKDAAIRVYESQLIALGELPEDGPVLPEGFLDHFCQEGEPLWPMAT